MNRFARSWELVKASAGVLQSNKSLLIYPLVSGIGVILVTLTFAIPLIAVGTLDQMSNGQVNYLDYAIAFLFYLVTYTVIYFANAALIGAAMTQLRGGRATAGDGFRMASQHFGAIVGYALISATVGLILRFVSERGEWVGRIVSSIIGVAWSIATFLAVPVLVMEGVNPIEAIKRSGVYLKRTWGEQIIGNAGVGFVFGMIDLAIILICGAVIFLSQSLVVIIPVIALGLVAFIVVSLIHSALSGIYSAAIYRYAAEGVTGGYFNQSIVQNAFQQKTSNRGNFIG